MVKDDEEAQRILQTLMENLGEASGVLHGLGEYLEYMEDRGQRVIRKLIRAATILAVGFVAALFITGLAIDKANDEADNAHRQADRAAMAIKKNRLAIRVGCVLLSNAIIDSAMPPASTQLLIGSLLKLMPPEDRKQFEDLQKQEDEEGTGLRPPDCDEVARNPEAVIEHRNP